MVSIRGNTLALATAMVIAMSSPSTFAAELSPQLKALAAAAQKEGEVVLNFGEGAVGGSGAVGGGLRGSNVELPTEELLTAEVAKEDAKDAEKDLPF